MIAGYICTYIERNSVEDITTLRDNRLYMYIKRNSVEDIAPLNFIISFFTFENFYCGECILNLFNLSPVQTLVKS